MQSQHKGDDLELITLNDIVKALRNTFGQKGMDDDNIKTVAEFILNYFGYEDYAIDNKLSSQDRDVFYMLEEEGILRTKSEEVAIRKGQVWRIHYWKLNKERIKELGKKPVTKENKEEEYRIYEEINKKVWKRDTSD